MDVAQDELLDGIMMARRLAQFCPTSLSLEEIPHKQTRKRRRHRSKAPAHPPVEFIPPVSQVVTEASSAFNVNLPVKRHRFGFLLEDIKPIEIEKPAATPTKMRYELPNVKQVASPGKLGRPLMVVSLSSTDLKGKSAGK